VSIIKNNTTMQENKQLIVLTHLSQLVTLIIGFGSLLLDEQDDNKIKINKRQVSLVVWW